MIDNDPLPRFQRFALPLTAAAVAILLWQFAVQVSHTSIFPAPLAVARAIAGLARHDLLWFYIRDSAVRVFAGYGCAVVLAIPAGVLAGSSEALATMINPLVQLLRPISPLAWMPLAVIWFGVSNAGPIFLIFLASFFPLLIATISAVRSVAPVYMQAGRNFGLSRSALLLRVVIPASVPGIVIGLRIAFGVAWIVLVAAEMIAVDSGLGYLIIDARNAGKHYDLVVAGMLLIGLIGIALDTAITGLERLPSVRWAFRIE